MPNYYDGNKLLSLLDIDGNKPEIYICTTNRTGGKTVYFSRLLVNKFIQSKEKFCLLYRYKYELDNVADKFFKDINGLFFNEYSMYSESKAKGVFHELYLCKGDKKEICGYAIALNCADQIKKYSHFFSDISRILFDEFQSETNHYCTNEINKFLSVHTSIARGQGEQSRYVPVYMLSNPVSLLNPYYVQLGITTRLRDSTKFLRGVGFVMEQGFIESAANAQKQSAFNKAFAGTNYLAYATENVYLNDNATFIEKPKGKSNYLCTLKCDGINYAIREFPEHGVLYCDNTPDLTHPERFSVTTTDHNINYVMLKRGELFISTLRFYFEHGCFRFKDLSCKNAVLKALSY